MGVQDFLRSVETPRHHALGQTNVGFYAVFLPDGYDDEANVARRYPLCVLLHGQGSTETKLADRIFPALRLPDVLYVAPRAPHAHDEAFSRGEPGFRAWPMAWSRWGEPGFPREDVEAMDVPRLYTDWIARCVDDVRRRYRVDAGKVMVVGGSEGATYAHVFSAHHPDLVARYFAYAGGPFGFTLTDQTCAREFKAHAVLPLIAHNRRDPENNFEGSEELAAYLESHGVPHATCFPDDEVHQFTEKVLERGRAFMEDWIGSTKR